MTNNKKAALALNELIAEYNVWAESIQKDPRQLQGVHLSSTYGYVYIRNMARGVVSGELVVCLSTIDLHPQIQNEGVFTGLIHHIEANPFAFKELEVENVMVEHLVKSLERKGFEDKALYNITPLPVTLTKKLVLEDNPK